MSGKPVLSPAAGPAASVFAPPKVPPLATRPRTGSTVSAASATSMASTPRSLQEDYEEQVETLSRRLDKTAQQMRTMKHAMDKELEEKDEELRVTVAELAAVKASLAADRSAVRADCDVITSRATEQLHLQRRSSEAKLRSVKAVHLQALARATTAIATVRDGTVLGKYYHMWRRFVAGMRVAGLELELDHARGEVEEANHRLSSTIFSTPATLGNSKAMALTAPGLGLPQNREEGVHLTLNLTTSQPHNGAAAGQGSTVAGGGGSLFAEGHGLVDRMLDLSFDAENPIPANTELLCSSTDHDALENLRVVVRNEADWNAICDFYRKTQGTPQVPTVTAYLERTLAHDTILRCKEELAALRVSWDTSALLALQDELLSYTKLAVRLATTDGPGVLACLDADIATELQWLQVKAAYAATHPTETLLQHLERVLPPEVIARCERALEAKAIPWDSAVLIEKDKQVVATAKKAARLLGISPDDHDQLVEALDALVRTEADWARLKEDFAKVYHGSSLTQKLMVQFPEPVILRCREVLAARGVVWNAAAAVAPAQREARLRRVAAAIAPPSHVRSPVVVGMVREAVVDASEWGLLGRIFEDVVREKAQPQPQPQPAAADAAPTDAVDAPDGNPNPTARGGKPCGAVCEALVNVLSRSLLAEDLTALRQHLLTLGVAFDSAALLQAQAREEALRQIALELSASNGAHGRGVAEAITTHVRGDADWYALQRLYAGVALNADLAWGLDVLDDMDSTAATAVEANPNPPPAAAAGVGPLGMKRESIVFSERTVEEDASQVRSQATQEDVALCGPVDDNLGTRASSREREDAGKVAPAGASFHARVAAVCGAEHLAAVRTHLTAVGVPFDTAALLAAEARERAQRERVAALLACDDEDTFVRLLDTSVAGSGDWEDLVRAYAAGPQGEAAENLPLALARRHPQRVLTRAAAMLALRGVAWDAAHASALLCRSARTTHTAEALLAAGTTDLAWLVRDVHTNAEWFDVHERFAELAAVRDGERLNLAEHIAAVWAASEREVARGVLAERGVVWDAAEAVAITQKHVSAEARASKVVAALRRESAASAAAAAGGETCNITITSTINNKHKHAAAVPAPAAPAPAVVIRDLDGTLSPIHAPLATRPAAAAAGGFTLGAAEDAGEGAMGDNGDMHSDPGTTPPPGLLTACLVDTVSDDADWALLNAAFARLCGRDAGLREAVLGRAAVEGDAELVPPTLAAAIAHCLPAGEGARVGEVLAAKGVACAVVPQTQDVAVGPEAIDMDACSSDTADKSTPPASPPVSPGAAGAAAFAVSTVERGCSGPVWLPVADASVMTDGAGASPVRLVAASQASQVLRADADMQEASSAGIPDVVARLLDREARVDRVVDTLRAGHTSMFEDEDVASSNGDSCPIARAIARDLHTPEDCAMVAARYCACTGAAGTPPPPPPPPPPLRELLATQLGGTVAAAVCDILRTRGMAFSDVGTEAPRAASLHSACVSTTAAVAVAADMLPPSDRADDDGACTMTTANALDSTVLSDTCDITRRNASTGVYVSEPALTPPEPPLLVEASVMMVSSVPDAGFAAAPAPCFVRGHDGRPLPGYTVAADGKTVLAPTGDVVITPAGKPVAVDAAGWPVDKSGPLRLVPIPHAPRVEAPSFRSVEDEGSIDGASSPLNMSTTASCDGVDMLLCPESVGSRAAVVAGSEHHTASSHDVLCLATCDPPVHADGEPLHRGPRGRYYFKDGTEVLMRAPPAQAPGDDEEAPPPAPARASDGALLVLPVHAATGRSGTSSVEADAMPFPFRTPDGRRATARPIWPDGTHGVEIGAGRGALATPSGRGGDATPAAVAAYGGREVHIDGDGMLITVDGQDVRITVGEGTKPWCVLMKKAGSNDIWLDDDGAKRDASGARVIAMTANDGSDFHVVVPTVRGERVRVLEGAPVVLMEAAPSGDDGPPSPPAVMAWPSGMPVTLTADGSAIAIPSEVLRADPDCAPRLRALTVTPSQTLTVAGAATADASDGDGATTPTARSAPFQIVVTRAGRVTARTVTPTMVDGFAGLHTDMDGEWCTARGEKVVTGCVVADGEDGEAVQRPLRACDGAYVVRRWLQGGMLGAPELDDGRRVCCAAFSGMANAVKPLATGGGVVAHAERSAEGYIVMNASAEPLRAWVEATGSTTRCLLHPTTLIVHTEHGAGRVTLVPGASGFAALVASRAHPNLYYDGRGRLCLADGRVLLTADSAEARWPRPVVIPGGGLVLATGLSEDGAYRVTHRAWKDGTAVVAEAAAPHRVLSKAGGVLPVTYDGAPPCYRTASGAAADIIETSDGRVLLAEVIPEAYVAVAFPLEEAKGPSPSHRCPLARTAAGEYYACAPVASPPVGDTRFPVRVVAGGAPPLPLIDPGTNQPVVPHSAHGGYALPSGARVPAAGSAPLLWSSGAPVVCDARTLRVVPPAGAGNDSSRSDGLTFDEASGTLQWVDVAAPAERPSAATPREGVVVSVTPADDFVVELQTSSATAYVLLRRSCAGADADSSRAVPCARNGLPHATPAVFSADGRAVVVASAGMFSLEDGTRVARDRSSTRGPATWRDGSAVVAVGAPGSCDADAVLDPRGRVLRGVRLAEDAVVVSADTGRPVILFEEAGGVGASPAAIRILETTDAADTYRDVYSDALCNAEGEALCLSADHTGHTLTPVVAVVSTTPDAPGTEERVVHDTAAGGLRTERARRRVVADADANAAGAQRPLMLPRGDGARGSGADVAALSADAGGHLDPAVFGTFNDAPIAVTSDSRAVIWDGTPVRFIVISDGCAVAAPAASAPNVIAVRPHRDAPALWGLEGVYVDGFGTLRSACGGRVVLHPDTKRPIVARDGRMVVTYDFAMRPLPRLEGYGAHTAVVKGTRQGNTQAATRQRPGQGALSTTSFRVASASASTTGSCTSTAASPSDVVPTVMLWPDGAPVLLAGDGQKALGVLAPDASAADDALALPVRITPVHTVVQDEGREVRMGVDADTGCPVGLVDDTVTLRPAPAAAAVVKKILRDLDGGARTLAGEVIATAPPLLQLLHTPDAAWVVRRAGVPVVEDGRAVACVPGCPTTPLATPSGCVLPAATRLPAHAGLTCAVRGDGTAATGTGAPARVVVRDDAFVPLVEDDGRGCGAWLDPTGVACTEAGKPLLVDTATNAVVRAPDGRCITQKHAVVAERPLQHPEYATPERWADGTAVVARGVAPAHLDRSRCEGGPGLPPCRGVVLERVSGLPIEGVYYHAWSTADPSAGGDTATTAALSPEPGRGLLGPHPGELAVSPVRQGAGVLFMASPEAGCTSPEARAATSAMMLAAMGAHQPPSIAAPQQPTGLYTADGHPAVLVERHEHGDDAGDEVVGGGAGRTTNPRVVVLIPLAPDRSTPPLYREWHPTTAAAGPSIASPTVYTRCGLAVATAASSATPLVTADGQYAVVETEGGAQRGAPYAVFSLATGVVVPHLVAVAAGKKPRRGGGGAPTPRPVAWEPSGAPVLGTPDGAVLRENLDPRCPVVGLRHDHRGMLATTPSKFACGWALRVAAYFDPTTRSMVGEDTPVSDDAVPLYHRLGATADPEALWTIDGGVALTRGDGHLVIDALRGELAVRYPSHESEAGADAGVVCTVPSKTDLVVDGMTDAPVELPDASLYTVAAFLTAYPPSMAQRVRLEAGNRVAVVTAVDADGAALQLQAATVVVPRAEELQAAPMVVLPSREHAGCYHTPDGALVDGAGRFIADPVRRIAADGTLLTGPPGRRAMITAGGDAVVTTQCPASLTVSYSEDDTGNVAVYLGDQPLWALATDSPPASLLWLYQLLDATRPRARARRAPTPQADIVVPACMRFDLETGRVLDEPTASACSTIFWDASTVLCKATDALVAAAARGRVEREHDADGLDSAALSPSSRHVEYVLTDDVYVRVVAERGESRGEDVGHDATDAAAHARPVLVTKHNEEVVLRTPPVGMGGEGAAAVNGVTNLVLYLPLTSPAGRVVIRRGKEYVFTDGTAVVVDAENRPVVYRGFALGIDAATRQVVRDAAAAPPAGSGLAAHPPVAAKASIKIAGVAITADYNGTMRYGKEPVVVAAAGDRLLVAKTHRIAYVDAYTGTPAPATATAYVDERGEWWTACGRRVVADANKPVATLGQWVVYVEDAAPQEQPRYQLADGTEVLSNARWDDGSYLTAESASQPYLLAHNGKQYVLGPDGKPVVLRQGKPFANAANTPLHVVVKHPSNTALVLAASAAYPSLFTDSEGTLRGAGGETVATDAQGEPWTTSDGGYVYNDVASDTRAMPDTAETRAPLYPRADARGRVVVQVRLVAAAGGGAYDWPVPTEGRARGGGVGEGGNDGAEDGTLAALFEPCPWGSAGGLAWTADANFRTERGGVVDGVTVLPTGVAVDMATQAPVRLTPRPDGTCAVAVWHKEDRTWRLGDASSPSPCTPDGDKLAVHAVTKKPLRAADGRWVLEKTTPAHARGGPTAADRSLPTPRRYILSDSAPATGTAVVATTPEGTVRQWQSGAAVVSAGDGRTLLGPTGVPVDCVVIHRDGSFVHARTHEDVIVLETPTGATSSDGPSSLLVLTHHRGPVYTDEAGVKRIADGRAVVLAPSGLPYKGVGNQLAVWSSNSGGDGGSSGSEIITLEDGTRVAVDPDTRLPMTWSSGKVVTKAQGLSVGADGVLVFKPAPACGKDATTRVAKITPNDHILLATPHRGLWEHMDGAGLALSDGRVVEVADDGRPIHRDFSYLVKETRRLEDGTAVAYTVADVGSAHARHGTTTAGGKQHGRGVHADPRPLLWNDDPAAPAVVATDGVTLRNPDALAGEKEGTGAVDGGIPAPDGHPVRVNARGLCVTASGEPVTLCRASHASSYLALIPKLDHSGRAVVVAGAPVYVDGDGTERTRTGDVVVCTGLCGAPDTALREVLIIRAGSRLYEEATRRVVVRNRHTPDAPVLTRGGIALTVACDAPASGTVRTITAPTPIPAGVFADADGYPVDASARPLVLAVIHGSVEALCPAADPLLRGLYTPFADARGADAASTGTAAPRLYLETGARVWTGATGRPLKALNDGYVVVVDAEADGDVTASRRSTSMSSNSVVSATHGVYRFENGGVVAVNPDGRPVVTGGYAVGRTGDKCLALPIAAGCGDLAPAPLDDEDGEGACPSARGGPATAGFLLAEDPDAFTSAAAAETRLRVHRDVLVDDHGRMVWAGGHPAQGAPPPVTIIAPLPAAALSAISMRQGAGLVDMGSMGTAATDGEPMLLVPASDIDTAGAPRTLCATPAAVYRRVDADACGGGGGGDGFGNDNGTPPPPQLFTATGAPVLRHERSGALLVAHPAPESRGGVRFTTLCGRRVAVSAAAEPLVWPRSKHLVTVTDIGDVEMPGDVELDVGVAPHNRLVSCCEGTVVVDIHGVPCTPRGLPVVLVDQISNDASSGRAMVTAEGLVCASTRTAGTTELYINASGGVCDAGGRRVEHEPRVAVDVDVVESHADVPLLDLPPRSAPTTEGAEGDVAEQRGMSGTGKAFEDAGPVSETPTVPGRPGRGGTGPGAAAATASAAGDMMTPWSLGSAGTSARSVRAGAAPAALYVEDGTVAAATVRTPRAAKPAPALTEVRDALTTTMAANAAESTTATTLPFPQPQGPAVRSLSRATAAATVVAQDAPESQAIMPAPRSGSYKRKAATERPGAQQEDERVSSAVATIALPPVPARHASLSHHSSATSAVSFPSGDLHADGDVDVAVCTAALARGKALKVPVHHTAPAVVAGPDPPGVAIDVVPYHQGVSAGAGSGAADGVAYAHPSHIGSVGVVAGHADANNHNLPSSAQLGYSARGFAGTGVVTPPHPPPPSHVTDASAGCVSPSSLLLSVSPDCGRGVVRRPVQNSTSVSHAAGPAAGTSVPVSRASAVSDASVRSGARVQSQPSQPATPVSTGGTRAHPRAQAARGEALNLMRVSSAAAAAGVLIHNTTATTTSGAQGMQLNTSMCSSIASSAGTPASLTPVGGCPGSGRSDADADADADEVYRNSVCSSREIQAAAAVLGWEDGCAAAAAAPSPEEEIPPPAVPQEDSRELVIPSAAPLETPPPAPWASAPSTGGAPLEAAPSLPVTATASLAPSRGLSLIAASGDGGGSPVREREAVVATVAPAAAAAVADNPGRPPRQHALTRAHEPSREAWALRHQVQHVHRKLNDEIQQRLAADLDARVVQQKARWGRGGQGDDSATRPDPASATPDDPLLDLSLSPIHHTIVTPESYVDSAADTWRAATVPPPPPTAEHVPSAPVSAADTAGGRSDSTIEVIAEPCYMLDEFY